MTGLAGMRVALLEARMSGELAALVRRHGGEPCCVPAVREERTPCSDQVVGLLERLAVELSPVVILSTGVGVAALFADARALGREAELAGAMRRATTVCRGPKPVAALKRVGIEASVRVKEPYTTGDLIEALEPMELRDRYLAVVHYGDRNTSFVEAVARRGARIDELVFYEWKLPEDPRPLRRLVVEIVEGSVGAVVFTSQVQARHLFRIAAEMGRASALESALRAHAVVAAVGPTCARALEALGVPPHVVPHHPKMGPMIEALAAYVSRGRNAK